MLNTDILTEQLTEIGIKINKEQLEKLDIFSSMLVKDNGEYNLTGITNENDLRCKHIIDSLLINKTFSFDKIKKIIDVGTGAGFPGIPISIIFPEKEVTLVDSLQKRTNFIEKVIKELKIKNVNIICERAEILGINSNFREKYDLCVSRAVTRLSTLLEICMPFIKPGGLFIAYKGINYEEDLINASNALKLLGINVKKDVAVKEEIIPATSIKRYFIKVLKRNKIPDKFPRRNGIPFKRPL